MRQRLENVADRDEAALALLRAGDVEGLLALHRDIFGDAQMVAEEDADSSQDGEDDEEEEPSDAGAQPVSDEDDEDDEDDTDVPALRARVKELSDEAKRYRLKARDRANRIKELESEIATLKSGRPSADAKSSDAKTEDDPRSSEELQRLKRENETLSERLTRQALQLAFTNLTTGEKPLARFKNPAKAFKLLDLDDVEIEEDGDIVGLDEAVRALAKSDPYLLVGEGEPAAKRAGAPAPGKKAANPNREKLISKYPALRR